MAMLRVATLAALAHTAAADVVVASFDGENAETELTWETVNDPVMGGSSWSNEHEETGRGVEVWTGEVKKVIFLQKPGFCTIRSPPRSQEGEVEFPDLDDTNGIAVTLRQTQAGGLNHFGVRFRTSSMTEPETSYHANFFVEGNMREHFVKWTDFMCTWRGEESDKCVEGGLAAELSDITSVGLGTYYPGEVGPFTIEIQSIVAKGTASAEKKDEKPTSKGATQELAHALKTTRIMDMKVFV